MLNTDVKNVNLK